MENTSGRVLNQNLELKNDIIRAIYHSIQSTLSRLNPLLEELKKYNIECTIEEHLLVFLKRLRRILIITYNYFEDTLNNHSLELFESETSLNKVLNGLLKESNKFINTNMDTRWTSKVNRDNKIPGGHMSRKEINLDFLQRILHDVDYSFRLVEDKLKNKNTFKVPKFIGGKPSLKKSPVKKSPVKKSPVKKSPVKKSPVKKSPVKKSPVKKSPVKKSPIKKSPVKKSAVKK